MLNLALMSRWQNWAIVTLMVAIPLILATALLPSFDSKEN